MKCQFVSKELIILELFWPEVWDRPPSALLGSGAPGAQVCDELSSHECLDVPFLYVTPLSMKMITIFSFKLLFKRSYLKGFHTNDSLIGLSVQHSVFKNLIKTFLHNSLSPSLSLPLPYSLPFNTCLTHNYISFQSICCLPYSCNSVYGESANI